MTNCSNCFAELCTTYIRQNSAGEDEKVRKRESVLEKGIAYVSTNVCVCERGFVSARVNIYRYIEKTECEV